jgi:zinc transporter ZupT
VWCKNCVKIAKTKFSPTFLLRNHRCLRRCDNIFIDTNSHCPTGDFAVLLKAGMSVQKAVVYNIVSSVLSFTGMAVGVWIGEHEAATQWIYAFTAGTFLYISLADLVSMHRDYNTEHSLNHKYQARGLMVQFSMMHLCTYGSL